MVVDEGNRGITIRYGAAGEEEKKEEVPEDGVSFHDVSPVFLLSVGEEEKGCVEVLLAVLVVVVVCSLRGHAITEETQQNEKETEEANDFLMVSRKIVMGRLLHNQTATTARRTATAKEKEERKNNNK